MQRIDNYWGPIAQKLKIGHVTMTKPLVDLIRSKVQLLISANWTIPASAFPYITEAPKI